MKLSDITTGAVIKPPTLFVYGVEGIGKTSFAASAPDPIFIQTEDGLGALSCARFPLAASYQEVIDAISVLVDEQHDFRTVALDSADWLESLIWQVVGKKPDSETAYGKGYVFAASMMRTVLEGLTYLRDQKGMNVIVLGHAQVKHYKSPETDDYDRFMPKLQDRTSALIREWSDAVLFANYQVSTNRAGKGVSSGDRYLFTEEKPGHLAKNRFNLPERIQLHKGTGWQDFFAAYQAAFTN